VREFGRGGIVFIVPKAWEVQRVVEEGGKMLWVERRGG